MPNETESIAGLSRWKNLAVCAVSGCGIAIGHAPFSLIWIAFPALCLAIFWGMNATSARKSGWRGFWIGFFYAVVSINWIVEPFLVDAARHGWLAPFALSAMASGFGAFWALAFWAAAKVASGFGRGIAIIVTLTAVEMMRSYILTGFPWALLSYIWIDTPLYQVSAFVGPHGLTFLTLAIASAIVWSIIQRKILTFGGAIGALAVLVFAGILLGQETMVVTDTQPIIRLVQPNADQDQKWDPELIPMFYNRQLEFTAAESELTPDVIVWPEVAVPFLLEDPSAPFWEIAGAAGEATVILGARRLDGPRAYNSMAVLDRQGEIEAIYDKQHLVPFGEFIPGARLLGKIAPKALASEFQLGFTAGTGERVIDLGTNGKILPLICYEGIFPHELRAAADRPDWMLMITNDAWFGKFSGPLQHLAQARARSIETGMPMVRVANTGISAVIDANGRIVASLPQGQAGYIDVQLPAAEPATVYWKIGDIPAILMLIVFGSIALWVRQKNTD